MSSAEICGPRGDVERGWSDDTDQKLRWGFIRKVYGILLFQVLITTAIAGVVVFVHPLNRWIHHYPWLLIVFGVLALILLCPIFIYRNSHPINLILLTLFTACVSLLVGFSCSFTRGHIVLEALILTTTVTIGLTLFTFWGVNRGYDFSFLGPFLFASLLMLLVWGLIQAFFPLIPIVRSVYAALGALVFSGYIVYDTFKLIKVFSYDDYVWASLSLYLDIINLFLYILQILQNTSD